MWAIRVCICGINVDNTNDMLSKLKPILKTAPNGSANKRPTLKITSRWTCISTTNLKNTAEGTAKLIPFSEKHLSHCKCETKFNHMDEGECKYQTNVKVLCRWFANTIPILEKMVSGQLKLRLLLRTG